MFKYIMLLVYSNNFASNFLENFRNKWPIDIIVIIIIIIIIIMVSFLNATSFIIFLSVSDIQTSHSLINGIFKSWIWRDKMNNLS